MYFHKLKLRLLRAVYFVSVYVCLYVYVCENECNSYEIWQLRLITPKTLSSFVEGAT